MHVRIPYLAMHFLGLRCLLRVVFLVPLLHSAKRNGFRGWRAVHGGTQRNALLPEVPIIADTVTGFNMSGWFGFYAPAATPPAIVDLLSRHIQEILKMPQIRQGLINNGVEIEGGSPEAFTTFIKEQYGIFGKLIKDGNIKPAN